MYNLNNISHICKYLNTKDLCNSVKRWEKNRPIDESRIPSLKQYIKETNDAGLIYIANIIGGENYICYDGNNRLEALKRLNEFERPQKILVDIIEKVPEGVVIERYKNINKAQPVPELYENKHLEPLKKQIEIILEKIKKNYPKFKSESKNPRRPNYNKNILTNDITNWVQEHDLDSINVDKFWENLENLNIMYRTEINNNGKLGKRRYTKNVIEKCRKYDWFIFIEKDFLKDLEY